MTASMVLEKTQQTGLHFEGSGVKGEIFGGFSFFIPRSNFVQNLLESQQIQYSIPSLMVYHLMFEVAFLLLSETILLLLVR